MSSHRNRLSGAQYKQKAKERLKREEELLAKTPKLDFFVSTGSQPNDSNSQINFENVTENDPHEEAAEETEKVSDENLKITGDISSEMTSVTNEKPVEESNSMTDKDNLIESSIDSDIPISDDPFFWEKNDATIDYILKTDFKQNMDADFSLSKLVIYNKERCMKKSFFIRNLQNGQTCNRDWLIYSTKALAVFCGPCKLFGQSSVFTNGYNDWSNIHRKLKEHENSMEHKNNVQKCIDRRRGNNPLTIKLENQIENEIAYWREVLKRVVVAIKSLASRGLAFRGSDERFGSLHGGNYIMILEAIAEFDPFLKNHINIHGNKGKGNVSYLSSTICDEFIKLMAESLLKTIINEIKEAKYFSISADSTPDMSHVDQLTFTVRYVNSLGTPVERFLKFIPNCGHKAENLAQAIFDVMKELDLDMKNCRGQSYDNASNMAGAYSGLQNRIKRVNPHAIYVPCSAHSLNLVGTCAAENCSAAVKFFSTLQALYNFFSASTGRWEVLQKHLSTKSTVKNLSKTRWSARHDACKSLCEGWEEILSALKEIEKNTNEKPFVRVEASGISDALNSLEMCFVALVWNDILHRFNAVNKSLQLEAAELSTVVDLYQSLINFVSDMREMFPYYENLAKKKSGISKYKAETSRQRKPKLPFDEKSSNDHQTSLPDDDMRINVFYVILDLLKSSLISRCKAYTEINDRFGFLTNLHKLELDTIKKSAEKLVSIYPEDLEDALYLECCHFRAHLKSINITKCTAFSLCSLICSNNYHGIYPNIYIALCMVLCMMVSNCTGERSFSVLRRVKNYLRTTQGNDRLNALALLCIEADLSQQINYDDLIEEFANRKARKRIL